MAIDPRTALSEISSEGRLAAWTTIVVFVVTAVTVLVVWTDPLWRRCGDIDSPCARRAAAAGLFTIGAFAMLAGGAGIAIRLRRRPVDRDGSSRYTWWLGAFVAVALGAASLKIPAFTCEVGRFDALLERCMHPPGSSAPARWIAVKNALVWAGAVAGVTIALRPRWVRVTAPIAALAWFGVLGWIVADVVAGRGGL